MKQSDANLNKLNPVSSRTSLVHPISCDVLYVQHELVRRRLSGATSASVQARGVRQGQTCGLTGVYPRVHGSPKIATELWKHGKHSCFKPHHRLCDGNCDHYLVTNLSSSTLRRGVPARHSENVPSCHLLTSWLVALGARTTVWIPPTYHLQSTPLIRTTSGNTVLDRIGGWSD